MSRYDKETHKNMAYLKPLVEDVYNMYQEKLLDAKYIYSVNNIFRQILSYEKSKGISNLDTVKQIEIVKNMFGRHLKERLTTTVWTKDHTENKLKNIQEAIDIVIESEKLKNK